MESVSDKIAKFANAVIDKVLSLVSPLVLFFILCGVALLLLIFLIVMICQGVKISKLKQENAEKSTALEKERANKRIAAEKAEKETEKAAEQKEQKPEPSHAQVGDVKWADKDTPVGTVTAEEDDEIEVVEDESEDEKANGKSAPFKPNTAPKTLASMNQQSTQVKYVVAYDKLKQSWTVKKAGADRVVRRVPTKEEAMAVARELSRKTGASLEVHKKDGKFQKQ